MDKVRRKYYKWLKLQYPKSLVIPFTLRIAWTSSFGFHICLASSTNITSSCERASALHIPHIRIAFTVITLCQFLRRPAIKTATFASLVEYFVYFSYFVFFFRGSLSDKWIVHWNVICYALSVKLFCQRKIMTMKLTERVWLVHSTNTSTILCT